RAAARTRVRGLAARPLVHRRRGTRLRLHRRHRRLPRRRVPAPPRTDRTGRRDSPRRRDGGVPMSGYTIPNVIAQNPRGDRIMDVYSHLLSERIVYLGTEVDAGVANTIIAQLLHLDADGPDADVQLSINCAGGDPSAALAIYDTMQHIRPRVTTTCVGQAIGVGALLVASGAPGMRSALP